MKLKKGFTLAEVLIVLIIIGVIATLTIPSLMRGVQEAQWKTAYKKAFNAIVNICAMERVQGGLPGVAPTNTNDENGSAVGNNTASSVSGFFKTLQTNLSVRDYANNNLSSGEVPDDYKSNVNFGSTAVTDALSFNTGDGDNATLTWINTEDGLSYAVMAGTCTNSGDCTKANINAAESGKEALGKSALVVVVDVNGVGKTPNTLESQQESELDGSSAMKELSGDRYYIFIGADGAASGDRSRTVTGRITADVK